MKKLRYLVAALIIGAVTLTGCGKKETLKPEDAIKKAQETMKQADNFKMGMSMDVGVAGQGMTMNVSAKIDGVIDVKNEKTKMNMTASFLGIEVNTEMYTDSKSDEGKNISYSKQDDGTWTKTISDKEEANADVSEAMLEVINSGNNIKKVKADSKDVDTYEITIPAEKLASLMEMAGTDSMSTIDVEDLKGNVILKVSIDKQTNSFTKLYMDMKELLASSMDTTEDIQIEISKAEFTITFADYNKAGDVTIPSDVIENATVEEDDDYDFNFGTDDFDESDYEQVLKCTYSEINEEVKGEAIMNVGFENGIATVIYSEQKYTFGSSEEAKAFYNDYEADEEESISRVNNVVSVTSIVEKEEDAEKISYAAAKSEIESMGFTCE